MERFSRTVLGYHGCNRAFAERLLLGNLPIADWRPSSNDWDWLGAGVYFWEHSPERAFRWAEERHAGDANVVGAVIQLGRCFDLLNEGVTRLLAQTYRDLLQSFDDQGMAMPENRGRERKLRRLDCLVINDCLDRYRSRGVEYDTVRGAFWEGEAVYPTAGFAKETHIQLAVRNPSAILGVFAPNLEAT